MSVTDELLKNNERYARTFDQRDLPARPGRQLAVLACMDSRLDVFAVLGLGVGDAHVIRNAGGVVTDDAVRSLMISQRLLGTREIVLIHHTNCGMLTFTDEQLVAEIEGEVGVRPPFPLEAFPDLDESVRRSLARITGSPFIPHKESVRGFVFDVDSGALREVV